MADPLSIAAILGIVYIGRQLSKQQPDPPVIPTSSEQVEEYSYNEESRDLILNQMKQPGYISEQVQKKREVSNFGDTSFSQYVNGEPVHDMSSRYYVSNKNNNLSPTEKIMVGRGLGIDPSIPASGGFQQLYRVNPNNVGAYRLTTLPGRIAPGSDTTGWRSGTVGEVTQYPPSKTAFLPERRPEVGSRAQGQGGAITGTTGRESYVKTKRPTVRSETGLRTDGLEYAPAKRFVPMQSTADSPSRNKGDLNDETFQYTNNPSPGIHSFSSGYMNDPLNKAIERRDFGEGELDKVGFKVDDKRGNPDRAGNAGRMNVRASPLQQGGVITSVRSDTNVTDGYTGTAGLTGSNMQTYTHDQYYKFNQYKGHLGQTDFSVVKRQLANNPLAKSIV
jgi:hypothetical protein